MLEGYTLQALHMLYLHSIEYDVHFDVINEC